MPEFNVDALLDALLYDKENPLLFNNGFFVIFFGLFITLYYLLRNHLRWRRYMFCLFSLYFFYKASGLFVGLVILSAIVDFGLSNAIWRQRRPGVKWLLLITSIVFNLGLLFYFKYTDFFINLVNDAFQAGFNPLNLLLPIGISFYTFENLSYTIDVYRGQFQPARKFTDYLLFLSFFPKLVMGPIVRAHDFVPQINKPYDLSQTDFAKGFYLIISGLVKKLIISDFIALNFVNYVFDDPARYTGVENLFAVYGYAVVIYCDFSGYSDIAIGIARWLGFTIPPNFLSPYQSTSVTAFWKRWHISLSSWLKDYLYIPLGGNRRSSIATGLFGALFFAGLWLAGIYVFRMPGYLSALVSAGVLAIFLMPLLLHRKKENAAANMNLLATMLLGGFWHGANWNFIIWGALHGIALALHKMWAMLTGHSFTGVSRSWWYRTLATLLTFHFVCFCWIFFRTADADPDTNDLDRAFRMIYQITHAFDLSVLRAFASNYWSVLAMMTAAYLFHAIPDDTADAFILRIRRVPMIGYVTVFFGFLILYGFFKTAEQVMPIYLQF